MRKHKKIIAVTALLLYTFAYRQMADIKTDGTFHYSSGASSHGTARLKFGDFGWEYVIIGGVEETDSVTSFY